MKITSYFRERLGIRLSSRRHPVIRSRYWKMQHNKKMSRYYKMVLTIANKYFKRKMIELRGRK